MERGVCVYNITNCHLSCVFASRRTTNNYGVYIRARDDGQVSLKNMGKNVEILLLTLLIEELDLVYTYRKTFKGLTCSEFRLVSKKKKYN